MFGDPKYFSIFKKYPEGLPIEDFVEEASSDMLAYFCAWARLQPATAKIRARLVGGLRV